jgi:hypothetical protein
MKLRNDSTLAALTEEQQVQLYDWIQTLGYTETLKKVAAQPPDGFGLTTHRATLHGFFKRYQAQARAEDIAAAKETRPISSQDASLLFSDAENSFLHAAHQIATGPMDPDTFAKMNQWLQTHKDAQTKTHYLQLAYRKLVLAEQRHAFNREKYELNVAQMALQHAAALQRIHANTALDHEARLRAARDLLYGSLDPSPSVGNPPPPSNAK